MGAATVDVAARALSRMAVCETPLVDSSLRGGGGVPLPGMAVVLHVPLISRVAPEAIPMWTVRVVRGSSP